MKNKKFIISLIVVIIGSSLLGIIVGNVLSPSSNNTSNNKTITKNDKNGNTVIIDKKEKVKIVAAKTKSQEYEKYDNSLVSFDKPKGWEVVVAPFDYIHYSFKVYDPSNPTYMFIFGMKLEGFNKSQAAKSWQQKYYPDQFFAKLPVIDPQTTESFYKIWNETADYVNTYDAKSEYLPKLNEFTIVEDLGTNDIGGNILRATYTDSNAKLAQGLFTATVKSAGTYYVNSNVWDWSSAKIDVFPLNVYNIILMSALDEDFINWQPILDKCISTIEFSETFINGFNKEEASILTTIQANQKIYDSISDMIMDSWEKRNNSYDIISQKQSDATLGYERVYDTETNEVYKAYNGFTDDYSGSRYRPITDDMYTETISGYIEK